MDFEIACSEIDFILNNMAPTDLSKIPQDVIKFFKDNKSVLYKVKLDVTKNLYEQELKDETKAIIKILNAKYFGGKEEKQKINDIIKNEEIEEKLNTKNEMIIYKENKLTKIINKILKFFKITKE